MPPKTAWKSRPRDVARMLWIKQQACAVLNSDLPLDVVGPCMGEIEADHAGGGSGVGRKAADDTVISLCQRHHRSPGLEHLLSGKVPHGFVRIWKRETVKLYQQRYLDYLAGQEGN